MIRLIITFFIGCQVLFSQSKIADNFYNIPKELNCSGKIKSVKIKNWQFDFNKKDTLVSVIEGHYLENGQLSLLVYNNKYFSKKIKFNDNGTLDEILNKEEKVLLKQFFNKSKEHPDSIIIFRSNEWTEKYVNTFNENLVVKRTHYNNNKIEDYREYIYYDDGRLKEESYYNPDNPKGERIVSNDSNGEYVLSFYPLNKLEYKYDLKNDTIISVIIKPDLNKKCVTKKTSKLNKDFNLTKTYENDELIEIIQIEKLKDSIVTLKSYFKEGKLYRYYNTFENNEKLLTKWTSFEGDKESEYTIYFKTLCDKNGNWIRREEIVNGITNNFTIREIDYY